LSDKIPGISGISSNFTHQLHCKLSLAAKWPQDDRHPVTSTAPVLPLQKAGWEVPRGAGSVESYCKLQSFREVSLAIFWNIRRADGVSSVTMSDCISTIYWKDDISFGAMWRLSIPFSAKL